LTATAMAAVLAIAGPAALALADPDAVIKHPGQSYIGLGVMNDTGRNQTSKEAVGQGGVAEFRTRIHNVAPGDDPDEFDVTACQGNNKFGVKYFEFDGTNVTQTVKSGGFFVPDVDQDNSKNALVVVVKAKSRAMHGDKYRCRIEFESDLEVDVVRGTTRVV